MDVTTIEDLMHHFLNRLSVLNNAVILSNAAVDQNYMEVKDSLFELLDIVKLVLRSMNRAVDSAKEQLKNHEEIKTKCHDHVQHLQFVIANMPLKLPTKKYSHDQLISKGHSHGQERMDHHLNPEVHEVTRGCNYLDFLTVDEFEAVPKYMKGRLTYEKVNLIIEQLDKVFSGKYALMKQKIASLSGLNRKRVETFRLQENKDTEGILFITEKDITDFSSLKVDSGLRNIVTILRHCSIIHEIRGGGYVRFAITFRF